MYDPNFVPVLPFPDFKWKWACLQCTEGLNDPVVLLGVLFRMRKLEQEQKHIKYSSDEFAQELVSLSHDIEGTGIGVDLARRTGERNLIRNSGQYWSALGLIPLARSSGEIELTEFGRKVADRKISQTEFAAITIRTFALPNRANSSADECEKWESAGIRIRPLLLLLQILKVLNGRDGQGYLTKEELLSIVIPLSGTRDVSPNDYAAYVLGCRNGEFTTDGWPSCCTSSNDHRMGREFLLFLANYGYVNIVEKDGTERFYYNDALDEEITGLLEIRDDSEFVELVTRLKDSSIVSEMERKRVQQTRTRPNQARFRRDVLGDKPRCVITNVTMPEVLEAAHIVPFKYHGEDTIANGFCMRMDIHQLFDSGHLRIHESGEIFLTDRARMDYGALIPPRIWFPDYVNRDFVRWRWKNYNGL